MFDHGVIIRRVICIDGNDLLICISVQYESHTLNTYVTLKTTYVEGVIHCIGQILSGVVAQQLSEVDKQLL